VGETRRSRLRIELERSVGKGRPEYVEHSEDPRFAGI
jgi:hypothetical protein